MQGRSAVLEILRGAVDRQMLTQAAADECAARLRQLPEEQATPAWLVAQGILTAEQVAALVAGLSTQAAYPLGSGVGPSAGPPSVKPALPHIRGYEVIEVLGSGGMGVVYRANQLQPRRPVAVKVMSVHVQMTEAHRLRFEREAQAAADLAHPNVVTIYEYGVVEGVPFFSMELVEGKSLDRFVSEGNLPIEERLKLMQTVCGAVSYAHQRGVIHRDLKPANILVTAAGQPKVMDFGLAKVSESPDRDMLETLTLAGEILGTVPYMAPEQTLGRPEEIDIRTDVYALGVILYQVVTGRLPQEPRGEHVLELMRRIREEAPEPPSSVSRLVDDNLQTIILKALSKEKERRYQTAGALAADLGHYLADEPIEAKPPSAAYHVRKLVRRYRMALIPIGVAFAIIILIIAASFIRIRRERDAALEAKAAETREREAATQSAKDARQKEEAIRRNMVRSDFLTATDKIDQGRGDLAIAYLTHALELDPEYAPAQARLFTLLGQRTWPCLVASVQGRLAPDGSRWPRVFSSDGRWVVTVVDKVARVWEAATGKPVSGPMQHDAKVRWAVFSPDGQRVLTAAEDNAVRFWEASSGKSAGITIQHQGGVDVAIFAGNGRNIVTVSYTQAEEKFGQVAQVWDAVTGKAVGEPITPPGNAYCALILSPDAHLVATDARRALEGSKAPRLCVLDVSTGKVVGEPIPDVDQVCYAGFSPDGRQLVTAKPHREGEHNELRGFLVERWEAATGKPVGKTIRTEGDRVVLSPDGKLALVTGDYDGFAVYETETGRLLRQRHNRDKPSPLSADAFSPDAKWVVGNASDCAWVFTTPDSGGWKWSAERAGVTFGGNMDSFRQPIRHEPHITTVAFSPDSRWLATSTGPRMGYSVVSTGEGSTAIWAVPDKSLFDLRILFRCRGLLAVSPDTHSLILCQGSVARVWDASTRRPVSNPMVHDSTVNGAIFDPSGLRILTYAGKQARVWEAPTGKPVSEPMRQDASIGFAFFSPDGTKVLTVAGDGPIPDVGPMDLTLQVWEAATGKPVGPSERRELYSFSFPNGLALNSDGRWLLTCSEDAAQLWDTATGQPVGLLMRHDSFLFSAALSGDSRWVVTGSFDRTARLWEAGTSKPVGEPMRHAYPVAWAVFSPDGARILTSASRVRDARTSACRVWEVPTGRSAGSELPPVKNDAGLWFWTEHGSWLQPSHSAAIPRDGRWVTTMSFSGERPASPWDNEDDDIQGLREDFEQNREGYERTARVWDPESGKPVSDPVPIKRSDLGKLKCPEGYLRPTGFSYEPEFLWPLVEPGSSTGSADVAALIQLGEYAGGVVLDEKTGAPRQLSLDEQLALRHLEFAHLSAAYEALARWILRNPEPGTGARSKQSVSIGR